MYMYYILSISPLSRCDVFICIHFMARKLIKGLEVIRYWRNMSVTDSLRKHKMLPVDRDNNDTRGRPITGRYQSQHWLSVATLISFCEGCSYLWGVLWVLVIYIDVRDLYLVGECVFVCISYFFYFCTTWLYIVCLT